MGRGVHVTTHVVSSRIEMSFRYSQGLTGKGGVGGGSFLNLPVKQGTPGFTGFTGTPSKPLPPPLAPPPFHVSIIPYIEFKCLRPHSWLLAAAAIKYL